LLKPGTDRSSVAFGLATVCVAYAAQQQRSVVLEIGLPNGAAPQLRIADGGTGTVSLPSGS
jgi:hypothetical protein